MYHMILQRLIIYNLLVIYLKIMSHLTKLFLYIYPIQLIRYSPTFNLDTYIANLTTEKIFCPKPECGFACSTVDELKKHLHAVNHTPPEGYTCATCLNGEIFSTEQLAQQHIAIVHENEHNTASSKKECNDDPITSGILGRGNDKLPKKTMKALQSNTSSVNKRITKPLKKGKTISNYF